MDAVQLYDRLVRGNEFKNEDAQYLYAEFCRQWKVHIHKAVMCTLKETEEQTGMDAREYFETQSMYAMIDEITRFTNPMENEIAWGIYIAKIAHTLSNEMQVDIVYKISL